MRRVNILLEEIENNTRKLHSLNLVAEKFSRVRSREEILRIATEKVVKYLPLAVKREGDGRDVLFSLPMHDAATGEDGVSVRFVALRENGRFSPTDTSYINAMSGLMESALERIEAFLRISEAEEKYRDLFVSALEGIFRTRLDGLLVDANPALASMMGYDSVATMIAEGFTTVDHGYVRPDDRRELVRQLQQ